METAHAMAATKKILAELNNQKNNIFATPNVRKYPVALSVPNLITKKATKPTKLKAAFKPPIFSSIAQRK